MDGTCTRRDFLKITAAGGLLASVGQVSDAHATLQSVLPPEDWCREQQRRIPVLADVDVVVVGGSSRAVAAAVAAAGQGCKVYLVCPSPYLGEDICGCHLYNLTGEDKLSTPLARRIFGGEGRPTPLQVKTILEDELLHHGVDFLYSSMPTNVLTSAQGETAGVVIANRSGREAIRSRVLVDATHEATLASCLGLTRTPFKPGMHEYRFTVVGNAPKQAQEIIHAETWETPLQVDDKSYPVTQYTFRFDVKDESFATLAQLEQRIRTLLWDADQVDSSDQLWYLPSQTVLCAEEETADVEDIRDIPLTAFAAKEISGLWLLGPCAAVSRTQATRLLRPCASMLWGQILGTQVGQAALAARTPRNAKVKPQGADGMPLGEIRECLNPLRPIKETDYVDSPAGALPVLGHFDVVVMGGGTAGASAGISAARQGAKTLVLEYLHGLGGLSTLGMIGIYWDGFREGFSATVDAGVVAMGPQDHPRRPKHPGQFPADWKMEWLRREYLKAGGTLWFGVMGCGALTDRRKVKGVVVATPQGRGVVLADVVVDSSGAADIAVAAGASFATTGAHSLAVQGAGTGNWAPGDFYNNNDWLFVDDTDVLDVSRAYVQAKAKLRGYFDMVKLPQTRERRRVVGDYAVTVYDVISQRRYADTLSYHRSSFDTHGMVDDPYFLLNPPEKRHKIYDADLPRRCLLPKGLEGILVTGLGASADRDAMPVIRMQPCLQNQGYAVGYLAAAAARLHQTPRQVDIRMVQRHLVEIGNLPSRVLTDQNFEGYTDGQMKAAASTVGQKYQGLEVLLTDRDYCVSLLRHEITREHTAEEMVNLASVLCMLGDDSQVGILTKAVQQFSKWDAGWHYTGLGQFGACLSRLDALLMALGRAGKSAGLSAILEKGEMLKPENTFSHYRAIADATAHIGSHKAVPLLASLLAAPGVRYHAMQNYMEARRAVVPRTDDVSTRNIALKELYLAQALYRCGDKDGMAREVLQRYAHGLQAHYARFAYEVLTGE